MMVECVQEQSAQVPALSITHSSVGWWWCVAIKTDKWPRNKKFVFYSEKKVGKIPPEGRRMWHKNCCSFFFSFSYFFGKMCNSRKIISRWVGYKWKVPGGYIFSGFFHADLSTIPEKKSVGWICAQRRRERERLFFDSTAQVIYSSLTWWPPELDIFQVKIFVWCVSGFSFYY